MCVNDLISYFSEHFLCHCCMNADRECNETDIRLVDVQTAVNGRVEICLDGQWSPVCGKWWNYRDAEVVCRQLQYDGRELVVFESTTQFIFSYSILSSTLANQILLSTSICA